MLFVPRGFWGCVCVGLGWMGVGGGESVLHCVLSHLFSHCFMALGSESGSVLCLLVLEFLL